MGSIASKCAEDDERQAWEARKRKEEERIKPMSKATEEKSRQMITFSLPLIEIENNSFYSIDNYKESGLFLVKASDGVYAILDIDIVGRQIAGELLPINAINHIVELQTEISLKENFEKRFAELTEEMQGHLHHFEKVLHEKTTKTEDALQYRSGVIIEKLEELVEKIKQTPTEDVPKLLQGHISETALVEILRTIK